MERTTLNRRDFVHLTTAGAVGLSLLTPGKAEAMPFAGLLAAIGRFAMAVGSTVLADQLNHYLRTLQNQSYRERIIEANDYWADRGFGDTTRSVVRTDHQNAGRIYYPLVYNRCDCLHFAAPFFNVNCGCVPITHIEGGHMTGLALAGELLANMYKSSAYVNDVLFPKDGVALAEGDRIRGYSSQLVYRSNLATVHAHYEPKSETRGSVIVEAESNTNGRLLIGKQWDVRYA